MALEEERPGMTRSMSSTSIHKDVPAVPGPTGPSGAAAEPLVPVLLVPANPSPAAETAPKPEADTEEGSSSTDKDDPDFIMHPRSVYAVISKGRHVTEKFHWGIIIAHSQKEGILYHRVFDGNQWTLEIEENKDITVDKSVIVILKVGDVPDVTPQWTEAIQECIVPALCIITTLGPMNCRTFALAVIYEMGNGGFISLYPNWGRVKGIEHEGNQFASHAGKLKRRLVVSSQCCGI
ncbi:hypothetical protein FQN49_008812 [Arthroderma sp. PD_2]|nr:hypothetical protein FQN49_008812 [Arthroderma sp. PD_2]